MMNALGFAAFPLYLFGFFSRRVLYIGFVIQAAYLLARGITLGRIPMVGVHDTLNFLASSMVGFSIALYPHVKNRTDFFRMLAVAAAAFTALAFLSEPHAMPLPPVLKTYWFEMHVVLSFLSYALFGLAFMLGVIYMKSPDARYERMEYKAILVGYCLFSLSMIFGGIWAFLAWGTYWLWTPKELWTTILWIYYSLYLHARLRQWWAGRPSAVLGAVGFLIVLFTYLGVGLLMKSSHSF